MKKARWNNILMVERLESLRDCEWDYLWARVLARGKGVLMVVSLELLRDCEWDYLLAHVLVCKIGRVHCIDSRFMFAKGR